GARLFAESVAIGPGAWDRIPEPSRAIWLENASTFLDESREPASLSLDLEAISLFPRPVLLTHGDLSRPYFAAVVRRLAVALPEATVHCCEGAAHAPHVSHPEEFVRVVSRFCASADRRNVITAR
ncbi:MAG: alpha/beta fold hydrolase, partial [Thermomicrobiales bacterium]